MWCSPKLLILDLEYDHILVETLLNTINPDVKQEDILLTIFSELLSKTEDRIVDTLAFAEIVVDICLDCSDLADTYKEEIFVLKTIFSNCVEAVDNILFPYELNDYYMFVNWDNIQMLLVHPEAIDQIHHCFNNASYQPITANP